MTPERSTELAIEAVVKAEAAAPCPNHSEILLDLRLNDEVLSKRQGQAWHYLVDAARADGFDGDPDQWLQGALIFALQAVDEACPKCGTTLPPPDDPETARKVRGFFEPE